MGYSQEGNNQAVKEKLFTRDYILMIVTNGLLFFGFQFYPSGLPPFLKTLGADDIVLGFSNDITPVDLATAPYIKYMKQVQKFQLKYLHSKGAIRLWMGLFLI